MIKFRAWDKATSSYRKVLEIEFYPDGELKKVKVAGLQRKGTITPDKLVIEQFTGMKDVNGKDIYEGDILRTKAGLIQIVEQGILESNRENIISGFYANNLSDDKPHTFSYDDEVIGNAHENPKLLEEDK